jgi:DnaJ-class molecular chaperone
MTQNHYEVLGLNPDADEVEIRKAYRSLSLKYHPDRNREPDAGDKFREINAANEVLSDSEKRKQYDHDLKYGDGSFEQQAEMNDINNMMNQMFGGGGGFPGLFGGIRASMNGISPMERMHMGTMHMGTMHMGGMPNIRVFHNGQSVNMNAQFENSPFAQFFTHMQKPAPLVKEVQITMEQAYSGEHIPIEIEKTVVLKGIQSIEIEMLYIDIPQGIDNGETIIMKDMGADIDGNRGDLKIVFQVQNNTKFARHGLDLHYQATISMKEALCGFALEIKHLNGKMLSMNNKENNTIIKPNHKKTVPNLGMVKGGQTGNLVIEFLIEFPDEISRQQIDKLREIL